MRLHKIKIENINSLSGSNEIDLEGRLAGAGLFLIHGPTGAGKSTILDAICLALYGKTPRFDDKTKQKTIEIDGLNPNDPSLVMTRGTGSCLAEVELSMMSVEGRLVRYRASWSVQRARKNPTGTFQEPKRRLEVFEEQSGWRDLVSGTKKSDIEEEFGKALQGLSFDDFQRTTLLAQFAFRQFLEANEKQRGELLARMTDGGRFKAIGKRAYDARKKAEDTLKDIGKDLEGKAVLSAAEEAERRAVLEQKEVEAQAIKASLDALDRKRHAWVTWFEAKDAQTKAQAARQAVDDERTAQAQALEALAVDRALGPARAALDVLVKCETQAEAARTEALTAAQARDAAAQRQNEVAKRREMTKHARDTAAHTYEARRPELDAADRAWNAWRTAQEVVAAKTKDETAREVAWTEAVNTAHDKVAREHEARARLAETDQKLAAVPRRESLLHEVQSLEAMLAAQKKQRTAITTKKTALDKKTQDRENLSNTLSQTAAAQIQLEGAFSAAHTRTAEAERALLALLDGTSQDQAVQTYTERESVARSTLQSLDRLDTARAEVLRLQNEVRDAVAEAAQAKAAVEIGAAKISALEADKHRIEAGLEDARREVTLCKQVMHLIEQRSILQAGHACPLCGGVEHPYVEAPDTAPDTAQVEAELSQAQERHDALKKEGTKVERALTAAVKTHLDLSTQASGRDATAHERERALDAARDKVENDARALGMGDESSTSRRDAMQAELAQINEAREHLKALATTARDAKTAEDEARVLRDRGATERQKAEHDLLMIETSIAAEKEAFATEQSRFDEAETELKQRLESLEVREPTIETGVAEVRKRADFVAEYTREQHAQTEQVNTAERERAQADTARDGALRERDQARAERAQADAQLVAAKAALHDEGRDPAEVRAELERAERATRDEDEQASKELAAADRELASAQERAVLRAEAEKQAADALSAAKDDFETQRHTCGAASADEVRARSLDTAQRERWTELEKQLAHQQTAAEATVKAAVEAQTRAEDALAHEGEASDATHRPDAIEAERQREAAVFNERQQEIGALRAELQRNEDARAAVATIQDRYEAAKHDYEQWKLVAELIGTDEGKAFADLVQALNLRAVIDRANARLAGFMDRYALTQVVTEQGAPRLDFLIVDRFQDDAKRGTKSLSGGESFIVSLALALGLADLRSSRLRIDTLLIDEGFGSLDTKTLQDVLAALSALQAASGAQIGLISHVDGMKEVIPAQIEVVPQGDGRSKVVSGPSPKEVRA